MIMFADADGGDFSLWRHTMEGNEKKLFMHHVLSLKIHCEMFPHHSL